MTQIRLNKENLPTIENVPDMPGYDLEQKNCSILHLGVGNFHRSHQAFYLHKLMKQKDSGWRICGAGLMPQDIKMKEALVSQNFLYTLVTRELEKEEIALIGSIRDFIHTPTEPERFKELCMSRDLKILSLTITEKGYCYDNNWNLDKANPNVRHDLDVKGETPLTAVGLIVYGLKKRLEAGAFPLTILSCDNIPENGDVLKKLLYQFLDETDDKELLEYVKKSVTFPCTMVDRITPNTADENRTYLKEKYGITDEVPVFAEQFIQWVIEDRFAAGRPSWEEAGAQLVEDVKPYELMKIRLLNGGHSALAYLSLLAGYQFVDDAMNDPRIKDFVKDYMRTLKKTLKPIAGIDYEEYIKTLVRRFSNPAVRDKLLRLAEDGSSKILNFIVGGLLILLKQNEDVSPITSVLASWIVYLDQSRSNTAFEVKDPLAAKLRETAALSMNDATPFLSLKEVFPEEILQQAGFIKELNEKVQIINKEGAVGILGNSDPADP